MSRILMSGKRERTGLNWRTLEPISQNTGDGGQSLRSAPVVGRKFVVDWVYVGTWQRPGRVGN